MEKSALHFSVDTIYNWEEICENAAKSAGSNTGEFLIFMVKLIQKTLGSLRLISLLLCTG